MGIAAYFAIIPFIYGHILVLNLHSMCAALGGGMFAVLVFNLLFLSSQLSFFFISPFSSVIYFLFLYETCRLVYTYTYFCVYFYQNQFHFQNDNTAPFHSMVPTKLQLFLCLYLLFVFLNRRLLFCDRVYSISLPVWISVLNLLLVGFTHVPFKLQKPIHSQ